jgi:putative transposase
VVHVAFGVREERIKEILGLWIETNEGPKFWLMLMNELKSRINEYILIIDVDSSDPMNFKKCTWQYKHLQ